MRSHKTTRQFILRWTPTFEISFSGSWVTNNGSIFYLKYYPLWIPTFDNSFSGSWVATILVVQTQTTTAYCRIPPTLDSPHLRYLSGSWDTHIDNLLCIYTGQPRLRYLFQVVETHTMITYRILLHWTPTFEIPFSGSRDTNIACIMDPHVWDIFFYCIYNEPYIVLNHIISNLKKWQA
jgi:hypothetical protein